jgi:hypothetical protein
MAASALDPASPPAIDTHMSRLVFCVGFAVFLAIALVAQLLTMNWRAWLPGAEGKSGLIGGVKSAVYSFMSYIP